MNTWYLQRDTAFNEAEIATFPISGKAKHASCWCFPEAENLVTLAAQLNADLNLISSAWSTPAIGIAAFDMDSTLISIECIDEIADFAQVKPQVAAITERAMQGELDFSAALKARVALLQNLPIETLARVYEERLTLNPGVANFLHYLHSQQIPTLVVSGGFTYFVNRLAKELGMSHAHANQLEQKEGKLTGLVRGEIVDSKVKKRYLDHYAKPKLLRLAVGDGANDLPMLGAADIAVAFRAKPKVQAQCALRLNYCGMDAIIDWLSQ